MGPAPDRVSMAVVVMSRGNPPGTVADGGGASQRAEGCPRFAGPTGTTLGVVRLNGYICWRRDFGHRLSGFGRPGGDCRLDPDCGYGRTEADGRLWIGVHRDGPVQLF